MESTLTGTAARNRICKILTNEILFEHTSMMKMPGQLFIAISIIAIVVHSFEGDKELIGRVQIAL